MKTTLIIAALWSAQSLFATGACTAFFDGEYPGYSHRQNLGDCAAMSLIPGTGFTYYFMSGFLEYGWHL
jgi:hypothetical protein